MEFKRGHRADTEFIDRMCWISRCGLYRIAHIKVKFGNGEYYIAEEKLKATGTWWPIEWLADRKRSHAMRKFRTRKSAEKACKEHQKGRTKHVVSSKKEFRTGN